MLLIRTRSLHWNRSRPCSLNSANPWLFYFSFINMVHNVEEQISTLSSFWINVSSAQYSLSVEVVGTGHAELIATPKVVPAKSRVWGAILPAILGVLVRTKSLAFFFSIRLMNSYHFFLFQFDLRTGIAFFFIF